MYLNLGGIIPCLVTPYNRDGGIDEEFIRSEVDFQVGCGVSALWAGGSTGEGASLKVTEVRRLCAIVMSHVNNRIPVIAGVIADTTDEAIELGAAAKESGVGALQVTLPHYVFPSKLEEFVAYYSEGREKTGLRIILYNVLPWG